MHVGSLSVAMDLLRHHGHEAIAEEVERIVYAPRMDDGWPAVAAALEAAGEPWPTAAAEFDFAWLAYRGRSLGRRKLMSRWSWTDYRTRELMKRMS